MKYTEVASLLRGIRAEKVEPLRAKGWTDAEIASNLDAISLSMERSSKWKVLPQDLRAESAATAKVFRRAALRASQGR